MRVMEKFPFEFTWLFAMFVHWFSGRAILVLVRTEQIAFEAPFLQESTTSLPDN